MTRADQLPEDLEAERALLSTLCAPGSEAVAGVLASWRAGRGRVR